MAGNNEFVICSAYIGVLKGVHDQFVRPDVLQASEEDKNNLFHNTRGLTQINANSVHRSGIAQISSDSSVVGNIPGKWQLDRSYGLLIAERPEGTSLARYLLSFYCDSKAVINGVIDPDAVLYINSSTKLKATTSSLKRAQTDILSRMKASGNDTIIANTLSNRIHSAARSNGTDSHISLNGHSMANRAVMGDGSNLNSADSLAATLNAIDESARVMGGRNRTLGTNTSKHLEAVADGAEHLVEENTMNDNDLISQIINQTSGGSKEYSISVAQMRQAMGNFHFDVITTDMGDRDYRETSQMDNPVSAKAQSACNEILGLMIREGILGVKFGASNLSGRLEMVAKEGWMIPISVGDIQGLDVDAYRRQAEQLERTLKSEIEHLVLSRIFAGAEVEMIVDISLATTATVIIEYHGRRGTCTMQSGTSSAWSSINISDRQMGTNSVAQRTLIEAVVENSDTVHRDHLGRK